jgi:hypothetical protein
MGWLVQVHHFEALADASLVAAVEPVKERRKEVF